VSAAGGFLVRRATLDDADLIARHRAAMFTDMHLLAADRAADLREKTSRYLREVMPRGEYVGWLASPADAPGSIIAGAGAQLRNTLPHPREPADAPHGRQAIVLNVYTEPAWRGRGVAELLMQAVLQWAGDTGLHALVLHASDAGRPLYEKLGFKATNEMRYTGRLGALPGTVSTKEQT
jgi:GNAT superfamily N-acetyltransferase